MANEFKLMASLWHVPSQQTYSIIDSLVNQTTNTQCAGIITATTTNTSFDLAAITDPGLGWFVNLHKTEVVQIGILVSTVFYPVLALEYNQPQLLRLDIGVKTTALQYQTVSGTAPLQFAIFSK